MTERYKTNKAAKAIITPLDAALKREKVKTPPLEITKFGKNFDAENCIIKNIIEGVEAKNAVNKNQLDILANKFEASFENFDLERLISKGVNNALCWRLYYRISTRN